ncbi:MAG TPA: hypothetical protein VE954_27345 [Oligoflexus sp.]|uniref:hypothetical protein n=1 Tax=Oligoflexus sp. TaxID=1971216 RepID=UPI002D6D5A55|nr:hypothetical protein [Oligoflexus sp.]HYX36840.1 hypothetical protein [Oligoflexus sp.]
MRTDIRNRLLASVLIDPEPERILIARRRRVTAGSLVSMAIAIAAAMGLVMLLLSKLDAVLR